jgi:galactokinase
VTNETTIRVHAPGRVNLIGEHTDYTGGLAFPMAIDRGTTLTATSNPSKIELTSADADGTVELAVPIDVEPKDVTPEWGTRIAAMARDIEAASGLSGHLVSDIPAGAGLSSSAALMCALALALGYEGTPLALAEAARRAEHDATGVPTGIMDQLCIASAIEGHATLIDCHTNLVEQVPVPTEVDIVVRYIAHRTLVGSAYTDRVNECARAEAQIGPLRIATLDDVMRLTDPLVQRRARHVVKENQRVRDFADALRRADYVETGRLMTEGHASLRNDYDTSTDQMDAAVDKLNASDGVFGARMTGGGFGGCLVLMCEPGAVTDGWLVRASDGARVLSPTD